MAINNASDSFHKYLHNRFKGKLIHIGKLLNIYNNEWEVRLTIRIPEHEAADEIEIYRRINKVIEVIAEGE